MTINPEIIKEVSNYFNEDDMNWKVSMMARKQDNWYEALGGILASW